MARKFLSFFGIDLAEGGLFPLRLRRRFAGFVGLGLLLFLAASAVFFWQSSKSWFCNSCHIMRPYVASWRESTHGKKGIECIQCHFPPGFQNGVRQKFKAASMLVAFITGTYSTAPMSEIQDASCMRPGCHQTRLLEGKVDFKGVPFDHKPHLGELRRGKRLRCQTCHSQIVQGTHIAVTTSVCFTCHFNGLVHGRTEDPIAGCKGCHAVPAKPVKLATGNDFSHTDYEKQGVACYKCHFDSVQGDGKVPRQVCLGCHNDPARLARFDDHEFMHKNHVTDHTVACFRCHMEIRHGRHPEPEPLDVSCERCHEGRHNITAQLYRGTGARGVKDLPSGMSAARVQCIACHEILGGMEGHVPHATYQAGEKACIECHGKDIAGSLAEWKDTVAKALKKAEASHEKAETAAKALAAPEAKQTAEKLLGDARYNLDLVRYGRGVHNVDYAQAILTAVAKNAAQVVGLGEKK